MTPAEIAARLDGGLIPAVPVPFRGAAIAGAAQRDYARWMAEQPVAGVAVWAHTGRGPHLDAGQRREVIETWRAALPGRLLVAGASTPARAAEAKQGGADALLAFPVASQPVEYHRRLSGELPVIAFYLYQAAGGVAYDDATLHAVLDLPAVVGLKVATLDSVMTFQHLATVMSAHPDKVLLTGEDRFLGYSLMLGARGALIGMGAACTALQAKLLETWRTGALAEFHRLSSACDALAQATFVPPMEGYIRRMLWALAAGGVIPDDACDDPWGPAPAPGERAAVVRAVRHACNPGA